MALSAECHEAISKIITASHILHYHGVVDAYGHISVRNPDNKETYFMPRNLAPALVSTLDDIVEYHMSNAEPVKGAAAPRGYIERNIHAGIYRQYSTVTSVVHGHAESVVAFSILPEGFFKPVYHMSGFLGNKVPVFDLSPVYEPDDQQDLLIRTLRHGDALSSYFSEPPSTAPKAKPDHPVVLMRGHGVTIAADSIQTAVYQAIFTQCNARILSQAMQTVGPSTVMSGKGVSYLTDREAEDTWKGNSQQTQRPWGLWTSEVKAEGRSKGLYVNALENQDSVRP